jgi:hypothetical protein
MNMMRKILSALAVSLLSTGLYAAPPYVNIFRNDNNFNRIALDDSFEVRHSTEDSNEMMTVYSGTETISIPISSVDSLLVKNIDIPSIYISFPDYPDVTQIWEKDLYLDANMTIEGNGYTDSSDNLTLQVKGRGNSTWGMPKKPMRLKFSKKTSICGFKKAKNYALIANYIDGSHCRNAIALTIANRLGMKYANHVMPCDVYINGNYDGLFMLTEKIGINGASVDIDENTGVLFELSTEYDEDYKFYSDTYNLPVMVKDPDFSELAESDLSMTADERLAMWQADFNKAEAMIAESKAFEAFDLDSFVDFMLIQNIAYNQEMSHPKSVYVYKRSLEEGEKYYWGPAWDFDAAFNYFYPSGDVRNPAGKLSRVDFFKALNSTDEFKAAYTTRFNDFYENIYPDMVKFIDEYGATIETSAKMDGVRWPINASLWNFTYRRSSFDREYAMNSIKTWFVERVEYLKRQCDSGAIF